MSAGSQGVPRHFDDVTIRRATLKDAPLLALVGAATFLDGFAGVLPGDAMVAHVAHYHTAEAYTRYLSRGETAAWLATVVNDAPVGYAMLTLPELPADTVQLGDLELKRIYALSRFHGTGIAQRLMEAAIAEATGRGAQRLLLGVYAGNQRALRFYGRNGFQQIGVRQFQVGDLLCDDFVLARQLSQ